MTKNFTFSHLKINFSVSYKISNYPPKMADYPQGSEGKLPLIKNHWSRLCSKWKYYISWYWGTLHTCALASGMVSDERLR